MLALEIMAAEQHNRFVKRVTESGLIWALTTAAGDWVFSDSNEDGEEDRVVFLVWSDRAYAQRCAIEEWQSYAPASIPLAEFLEAWCAGLHNNQELVGTNWDGELHGVEIEPLTLVVQLLEALKSTNKALPFRSYSTMSDFEAQVHQIMT